ncbi:MAG: hypothetical protein VW080_04865 [Flavobacteriaceae bacterium]
MLNFNSEETRSSINKFEQMLKTNQVYFFDAQEFEDIVVHYMGLGDNQLAKKALKMGLKQHPSNLELMLLQSEVFILDEKFDFALDLLNYIEKLVPQNEEIALQKATIASKKGDHKASIELLHLALERSEDPIEIWNLLGMEHLLAEEYEQAKYFFKNCLLDNLEDYPSLYNLLYCYDQLNEDEEAIQSLNLVLEYDPYCEVAWHQLGKILNKIGKTKEAISAYDFAIICDDSFAGAYIEKGKILEGIGRINEAIENYEIALSTSEPSAFIYHRIGRCHGQLGNLNLAQLFYQKSVKLEPSNENSWESLIDHLMDQRKYSATLICLKNALEANGDSKILWIKKAELHEHLTQKQRAIDAYQKVIDLGYYELPILLKQIDLYLLLENFQKAYEISKSAFELLPESNELKYRIGGCAFYLKNEIEGIYFLDPQTISRTEAYALLQLFPKLEKILKPRV